MTTKTKTAKIGDRILYNGRLATIKHVDPSGPYGESVTFTYDAAVAAITDPERQHPGAVTTTLGLDPAYMGAITSDLDKPEGLDADGEKAYAIVFAYLVSKGMIDTGGCKAFYSPAEWRKRGEEYGCTSKLIVVYDGGDLRPAFNMDAAYDLDCMVCDAFGGQPPNYQPYSTYEGMQEALKAAGLYFEECTRWYAAVYAS